MITRKHCEQETKMSKTCEVDEDYKRKKTIP